VLSIPVLSFALYQRVYVDQLSSLLASVKRYAIEIAFPTVRMSVRPSVCLSVTRLCCDYFKESIYTITQYEGSGILAQL